MSKTQCKRVILYLKKNTHLTSLDAFKKLGITRLAARVFELSSDGYIFERNRKKVVNRFGERCSVIEYSIKSQP